MSRLSDDQRFAILLRINRLEQMLRELNRGSLTSLERAYIENYVQKMREDPMARVRQAINSTTLTRTPVPDSVEAWLDSEEGEEWLRK